MDRLSLLVWMAGIATGAVCLSVQADPVYKWVDSQGGVHYSSTPPPSTAVEAQKVNVAAPQVVSVAIPASSKLPKQNPNPRTDNGMDKAKAEAADKQIRATWARFKNALGGCQGVQQHLDDLRNGVTTDPVTHAQLTDALRAAMERDLEEQLQQGCAGDGN